MMHGCNSARNSPVVSDAAVRETLRRQIDRAINVPPRAFSRTSLAQESGVNVHTIDSILSRDEAKHRRIALADALSIAQVLGERAVNAILADIGFIAKPLDDVEGPDLRTLTADALKHIAVIASAAVDGKIDHVEEPATTEAADMLIATVLPISSAGK